MIRIARFDVRGKWKSRGNRPWGSPFTSSSRGFEFCRQLTSDDASAPPASFPRRLPVVAKMPAATAKCTLLSPALSPRRSSISTGDENPDVARARSAAESASIKANCEFAKRLASSRTTRSYLIRPGLKNAATMTAGKTLGIERDRAMHWMDLRTADAGTRRREMSHAWSVRLKV